MKDQKVLTGIKKTQGMLSKITTMIENDQYCADTATQINAAIGLLKEANRQLLKNHLAHCGKKKLISKNPVEVTEFIDELVKVRDVSTRK